jgi:hypothetical protein
MVALGSIPADNADGVLPRQSIEVAFSEPPDPDTVSSRTFRVTSGRFAIGGAYRVDLLEKKAIFQPGEPYPPGLAITVTLVPEVASLGGAPLLRPQLSTFRVLGGVYVAEGGPIARLAPTWAGEIEPLFHRSGCERNGCHGELQPAAGLDLSPAAGLPEALVGRASQQRPGLRLVAPTDSSRSYLLRKLVGTADILGGRMPAGAAALSADELRTVAAWIDAGAP